MNVFAIRPNGCDQTRVEPRSEQLRAAEAAFDSSTAPFKRIIENCKDLNSSTVQFKRMIEDSLKVHNAAYVKYRQALEDSNNFILDGQLPGLPEPHSREILEDGRRNQRKIRILSRATLY